MSNDNTLISHLYKDILKEYHFSLTGYAEEKYYDNLINFFVKFCKSHICVSPTEYVFILGIFSQIKDYISIKDKNPEKPLNLFATDQFSNYNVENIINWTTKPVQNMLVYNFEADNLDLIISIYLDLVNYFADKLGIKDKGELSATYLFSKYLIDDVDIRVTTTIADKPELKYYHNENVLEFSTPISLYIEDFIITGQNKLNKNTIKNTIYTILSDNNINMPDIITIHYQKNNLNVFDFENLNLDIRKKFIDIFLNKLIFKESGSKSKSRNDDFYAIVDFYKDEYKHKKYRSLKGKIVDDDENVFNQFLCFALAGSFLSGYYDINIDYILSVCNISDGKSNTLGGICVAKNKSRRVSTSERSMFSIISDHISRNLATQTLHGLFYENHYNGKANVIIRQIYTSNNRALSSILFHPNNGLEIIKKSIMNNGYLDYSFATTSLLGLIDKSSLKYVLSEHTYIKLHNYLEELKKCKNENDWYEYMKANAELVKKSLHKSLKEFIAEIEITFKDKIKFNVIQTIDIDDAADRYFDFDWIKKIVCEIISNSIDAKASEINIKLSKEKDNIIISVEDNGTGCDIEKHILTSESQLRIFREKDFQKVLNSHGDILVESNSKRVSIKKYYKYLHKKDIEYKNDSNVSSGTRFLLKLKIYD